jgi:putative ABC transport system permease protein
MLGGNGHAEPTDYGPRTTDHGFSTFRTAAPSNPTMTSFSQDIRYALRKLRKSPGFAALTILTLALGIGANSAIFSVVNGVVLRPLPYPEPHRLMYLTSQFTGLGFLKFWISVPEYLELRDWNEAFERIGGYNISASNLGTDVPSRPVTALVTHELLPVLGVAPLMGRTFTYEDTLPGAEDVAILSWELWQRAFGGDGNVLGTTRQVDGVTTRIVGVMPRSFDVHDQRVELWLPLTIDPKQPGGRGGHFLYLVGRLKPNVSMGQARSDVERLLKDWAARAGGHSPNLTTHRLNVDDLQGDVVGNITTALWVLQGAVGFVLLIACANLANLLLARADTRHREFAVRAALGAGRARLLRQFLTEGVVIAFLGGVLGTVLATIGLRALLAAYPSSIPRAAEISTDWRVLAFTLLVAVATGLVFGLAPVLHLRERAMGLALKDSGTRTSAGSARTRTRNALVMAEVALAVMLVVGAGLLLRSFWNLMNVDAGFDRSRMSTFGLVLPNAAYPGPQRKVDVFTRLLERIGRIPGVQSVAATTGLPPDRPVNANDTDFEGMTQKPEGPILNVDYYNNVTADYVQTMKIPVVAGRGFEPGDVTGGAVALINESLAKKFYPDSDPIGRGIRPSAPASLKLPYARIVGVLKDLKQGGVDESAGTEVFFLAEQAPRLFTFAPQNMNFVVRSSLPYETLAPQLRAAVSEIDAALPIVRMRTMEEVFESSVERQQFMALLLTLFAALALVLAAIGTYGILSYIVAERRQEIGIRMALGADRGTVLGMILKQGLTLTGVGLAAGIAGSFVVNRALASMLFNVRPNDPVTLAGVSGLIALVAVLACVIPARSATRVDPLVVLRQE